MIRARFTPNAWYEIGEDIIVCRQRELTGDSIRTREIVVSKKNGPGPHPAGQAPRGELERRDKSGDARRRLGKGSSCFCSFQFLPCDREIPLSAEVGPGYPLDRPQA